MERCRITPERAQAMLDNDMPTPEILAALDRARARIRAMSLADKDRLAVTLAMLIHDSRTPKDT